MNNVPEGAQLSEDGYYWWDGENWQAVNSDSSASTDGSAASGSSSGEDEEVAVRVEASLPEEQVDVTLDDLVAEGFQPDQEAMA